MVNDLLIIKTFMVAFQSSTYCLFATWQGITDTLKALRRISNTEDHLSDKTKAILKKGSESARTSMVKVMKSCAKAGADKIRFYRDEYHSTLRAFKVLQCVSYLDPRNIASIESQTYDRMGESFRGAWHKIVDRVEWDRFRRAGAGLNVIASLPTRAPQVFAWWAHDSVRDAFPTLTRFVLEVIVLLPSRAKNGCGV